MNNIIYRIYTEKKNAEQVKAIVSAQFLGFTLFEAEGVWNRQEEESLIIEVIGTEADELKVNKVANAIKSYNQQEAVLVTKGQIVSKLI